VFFARRISSAPEKGRGERELRGRRRGVLATFKPRLDPRLPRSGISVSVSRDERERESEGKRHRHHRGSFRPRRRPIDHATRRGQYHPSVGPCRKKETRER